jgi:protease-4
MAFIPGIARRAGANVSRVGRRVAARAVLGRRAPFWLLLRLAPPFEEAAGPRLPFTRPRTPSLLAALRALDVAAGDPRVAGVVLRFAGAPHGFAAAASLRRAVDAVRAAGKPVAAYGESLQQGEYLVASGADRLWLPETGSIQLVGLRSEALFVTRLFERLSLKPDVVRVGSHKSAGEMFTRRALSPEAREQTETLLDDLLGSLVDAIAAGRRLDASIVRGLVDRGPYRAQTACEAGLADAIRYPDEIEAALAEWVPESAETAPGDAAPRVRLVDVGAYAALHAHDAGFAPWLREQPRIAYIVAQGPIRRRGPGGISVEALTRLLREIGAQDAVRAVVLRIESPGGDAMASDLLWRALTVVKRDRPLVVSMGEVAASGGYFAAVAADGIFAEASTLTGSIGVVGGKLDAGDALAKLGVDTDAVERGHRAGLLSAVRGFTPEERAVVRSDMEAIYDVFARRVAEGRKLDRAAVEGVAQGRVWSGRRAVEHGLVDAIGGPLEAIREARARAGLAAHERAVLQVFPRIVPMGAMRALLGLETRLEHELGS